MIILFIDDDADDTELFCEAVAYLNSIELFKDKEENIECVSANDGCQAIELLPNLHVKPDLIFLDINMPSMGGKDCLKYLKQNEAYSNIPVIMFSTAIRNEDYEEFKSMGAIDCLKKPNGFTELVKILSKYVYKTLGISFSS